MTREGVAGQFSLAFLCLLQMSACLGNLSQSVLDMSAIYQATSSGAMSMGRSPAMEAAFLTTLPLQTYHKAEEQFTQQLTAFTKKQFFEVAAHYFFLNLE